MVANSRSTPARIGATALLKAVCPGLSGRLCRAWYMIRGSMPRSRSPARRASLPPRSGCAGRRAGSRLVGVHGPLVALDEVVGRDAVMHVGRGHDGFAHDPAALVQ